MTHFRVISIHGAPRSGTSWLGKIFDSHPDVAYRFQPLFSYRFKGIINADSTPDDVHNFLDKLYAVNDDEFILQQPQIARGAHPPAFKKNASPGVMVMKEVRYHYVIPTLLKAVPGIKIIGLVRHPCGAINSWLKAPREFLPEWNVMTEWHDAPAKNQGRREEYYGFTRWKELARQFLTMQQENTNSFYLVHYDLLVSNLEEEILKLFDFCDLDVPDQVENFLHASQQSEIEDADSVFRTPGVSERWKAELNPVVRNAIYDELQGTDLEIFL